MKENEISENVFENCKWIWADDNGLKNDWVLFRRKFSLDKPPKSAVARIGVCDKYNMYVNGKLVVFDGGLERESSAGNGYYDETDIAPYLTKSDNVIAFLCHRIGRNGNSSFSSAPAGLIFECPELSIKSDKEFLAFRSGAYSDTEHSELSGLYAAYDLRYDFTKEGQVEGVYEVQYGANIFMPAAEYAVYGSEMYGELKKRPIPLFAVSAPKKVKRISKESDETGDTVIADLGEYCCFVPIIEVTAAVGQTEVDLRSDRYCCFDTGSTQSEKYCNQRIEYVCSDGTQTFESPVFLTGSKIVIRLPKNVKLNAVSYRNSEYDLGGESEGTFSCGVSDVETLHDKAAATLVSCMRGTLWSTPERERAMFAGTVSGAAELCAYVMPDSAQLLVKKCIDDYIEFSRASVLYSCVPGENPVEIPSQNLLALGRRGFVAAYYDRTGDIETLKKCVRSIAEYLMLFERAADGLVSRRDGDRSWFDNGENIDEKVLENALYYSALDFLRYACEQTELHVCDGFIEERMREIENGFEQFYKGAGYTSKGALDDRANAWAVISGLAKPEHYPQLIKLLAGVCSASPYMENYVIDALFTMGAVKEAVMRLRGRYFAMTESDFPTLPEDFFTGAYGIGDLYNPSGALCYASTGGVVKNLYMHLAGVSYRGGNVVITPNVGETGPLDFTVKCVGGEVSGSYRLSRSGAEAVINNRSSAEVTLVKSGGEEIKLGKGKNKITL